MVSWKQGSERPSNLLEPSRQVTRVIACRTLKIGERHGTFFPKFDSKCGVCVGWGGNKRYHKSRRIRGSIEWFHPDEALYLSSMSGRISSRILVVPACIVAEHETREQCIFISSPTSDGHENIYGYGWRFDMFSGYGFVLSTLPQAVLKYRWPHSKALGL